MKTFRTIILCLVSLTLVGCNSATPAPTQEIVKTLTETPTQIEPTVEATATIVPEATATPTEAPAFYEENWGNWAKTLDAADVEKNGVIIPYNPVDNPEEFKKAIEEIKIAKHSENGSLGKIKAEFSGVYPMSSSSQEVGIIAIPFQVMYFKYGNNYYPFIMNGSVANLVVNSVADYTEFVERNVKGSEMSFYILMDPNKPVVSDFVSWGVISQEEQDIAVKTGMGIAFMRLKN